MVLLISFLGSVYVEKKKLAVYGLVETTEIYQRKILRIENESEVLPLDGTKNVIESKRVLLLVL